MERQNTREDFLLLNRLQEGDARSFEELFNQYWEPLYVIALNRLRNSEEAREIVQSLFVDLWQRHEQLAVKTSLKAYLYTALRYAILDHLRSRTVRDRYVESIRAATYPLRNVTAETVAYRELETTVQQGMGRLPERCRQVFRMRRLEHYSVKEIALKLGVSSKTVENQLTKATKVLRLHLKEHVTLFLVALINLF